MKRNSTEERLIEIRRFRRKMEELYSRSCEKIPIPLEEPIFAGWEYWVELSESRKRSKDAPKLEAIIKILCLNHIYFTRNPITIRVFRKWSYRYINIRAARYCTDRCLFYYNDTWTRHITKHTFDNLHPDLKPYFTRWERTTRWGTYEEYHLNKMFPLNELVVKVRKAYWKTLHHPNSEAQSEYDKMNNYKWRHLVGRGYEKSYNGKWEGRYRDFYGAGIKKVWKEACHQYKLLFNSNNDMEKYINVIPPEDEERVTKGKAFLRRYGWD